MLKYKKLPGESIYALKYEAELEVSIFNLCAMIYEVDIFPKWIPFCSKAKTVKSLNSWLEINPIIKKVKKISKAFKIAFFQIDPPFLYSREAYIKGIGVDRLEENGSILILSGSVDVVRLFIWRWVMEGVLFIGCDVSEKIQCRYPKKPEYGQIKSNQLRDGTQANNQE